MLAGIDSTIEPGIFHAIVTNWLGRGGHPLGMDADPGAEKWNYPTYAFSSSSLKRSDRRVEVKLNLAYIKDSNSEYQESPRNRRVKSFHYDLYLGSQGEIVGGKFYSDSAIIDMLWLPLRPKQGRKKGNESGNPYVDVNQVLAIWRESASPEERAKWLVVDPPREDRILNVADVKTLIPLQDPYGTRSAPPVAASPLPPLPAPASERSARREERPTVSSPGTSADALRRAPSGNAARPARTNSGAAATGGPVTAPLTVEPRAAESQSLIDIFSEFRRSTMAREPATVTSPLKPPVVPVEINLTDAVPLPDTESAEMTAEPVPED
jgi:hypothetical protein